MIVVAFKLYASEQQSTPVAREFTFVTGKV